MFETATRRFALAKALPQSCIAVLRALEVPICLHYLAFVGHSIERMAGKARMLFSPAKLIDFEVQTVDGAFKAIAQVAEENSVLHLISLLLFFDHEMEDFEVLGSRADGCALPEQRTSLEVSIKPMPQGTGKDAAVLRHHPVQDEEF